MLFKLLKGNNYISFYVQSYQNIKIFDFEIAWITPDNKRHTHYKCLQIKYRDARLRHFNLFYFGKNTK